MQKRVPRSCFVALDFPPDSGGVQTINNSICERLPQVCVLASHMPGAAAFDRVAPFPIYRHGHAPHRQRVGRSLRGVLGLPFVSLLTYLSLVARIIQERDIEVIQCGHPGAGLLGLVAKRFYGLPYVVYTYALETSAPLRYRLPWKRAQYAALFRNADAVLTISAYTRRVVETWGVAKERIHQIPLGVDAVKFHPGVEGEPVRDRYGLEGKRVLLTVARLFERKGIDMILRALPTVRRRMPEVSYLVVGDGPMRVRLEQLAQEQGVADLVTFAGNVPHEAVPPYYAASDVFVMPSRELPERGDAEGFGVVYLEANACGKPVIGGRSGGVADAVVDGGTGLLVDPEDPEAIAAGLVRLLQDDALARRLGQQGRVRVEKVFNWDNTARCVQAVLRDVVQMNRREREGLMRDEG